MNTDFFKAYGATERNDQLIIFASGNSVLFFGFGKDTPEDENGYQWRKDYDHTPTAHEVRNDINALVNQHTDEKILNGFSWNGKPVYLSTENQFNFKAAYDLAVQTNGATLPVKFKLGETEDGEPVYHTFMSLNAFADFTTRVIAFVAATLNEGWELKDSVDYNTLFGSTDE